MKQIEIEKVENNSIARIKPHKNWLLIIFLILFSLISFSLVFLYSFIIYFEKVYAVFFGLVCTLGVNIFLIRQLIWIFKGEITLEINEQEINIIKNIKTFGKQKSYYVEEIEKIRKEKLFVLKNLKKIPIFGEIYFSMIASTKKDSNSIVINYRGKEIEILSNLIEEETNFIMAKLNETIYIK
jgi:hypothetical protein